MAESKWRSLLRDKRRTPPRECLWQCVELRNPFSNREIIAVLCWVRGIARSNARSKWIGPDAKPDSENANQTIELIRFEILDREYHENCDHILKVALQEAPNQWLHKHGVVPVLAECLSHFDDCPKEVLKNSTWLSLGKCPKYIRQWTVYRTILPTTHHWVKSLSHHEKHKNTKPSQELYNARSHFTPAALKSLVSGFYQIQNIKDPRAKYSRIYPLGTLLAIICLSCLDGATSYEMIWRWSYWLKPMERKALGLRKRDKSGNIRLPSSDTYNVLANNLRDKAQSWDNTNSKKNYVLLYDYFCDWMLASQDTAPISQAHGLGRTRVFSRLRLVLDYFLDNLSGQGVL